MKILKSLMVLVALGNISFIRAEKTIPTLMGEVSMAANAEDRNLFISTFKKLVAERMVKDYPIATALSGNNAYQWILRPVFLAYCSPANVGDLDPDADSFKQQIIIRVLLHLGVCALLTELPCKIINNALKKAAYHNVVRDFEVQGNTTVVSYLGKVSIF